MSTMIDNLPIKAGSIITVVGAGGKTSTIRYLANKLNFDSIIITTTTHFLSFNSFAHKEIIIDDYQKLMKRADAALKNHKRVVLGRYKMPTPPEMSKKRINGLPPGWVDELSRKNPHSVILVEGDGSARLPIKAPALHEPVVPENTDLLLPVLGMKALDKKMNSTNCHRLQELKKLKSDKGSPMYIDDELIVSILTDRRSYGSYIPEVSEYIPLLNQVEEYNLERVKLTADKLIKSGLKKVILMDTHRREPLRYIKRRKTNDSKQESTC